MTLTPYPTYYNNEPADVQVEKIRTYLITFKNEIEKALTEISYDSLDTSVKKVFDNIDRSLNDLNFSLNNLRDNLAVNYTKTADIKENGIVIGDHTYTEQTATIDGTTIHYLGYVDP